MTQKAVRLFLIDLLIFTIAVSMISLFYMNDILLTVLLSLLFIGVFRLLYVKKNLYQFALGAFFGSLAEVICIHFGAWTYTNPTLFGIPLWLPVGWGIAVVTIIRMSEHTRK